VAIDFSLRQLEYAVAVADTLGFHKAAARCGVSQPTLSAQVQQLESVLGLPLFERAGRRVLLTAAGEELVARARRVLLEASDLASSATRVRDPRTGTLHLGVIPTVAPYVLPLIVPRIARAFPHLRLELREEKTADAMRALHEGRLDAALLALVPDLGDVVHAAVLVDEFVVALPKGHPLARKRRIAARDLDGARVLLLDDGHCFRSQALRFCARAGADEAAFRATSLATLAQMVSTGAAITLLPRVAVDVENRRGQLEVRPFAPPVPSRTLALVWRRSSPLDAALHELADVVRRALGKRSHG